MLAVVLAAASESKEHEQIYDSNAGFEPEAHDAIRRDVRELRVCRSHDLKRRTICFARFRISGFGRARTEVLIVATRDRHSASNGCL